MDCGHDPVIKMCCGFWIRILFGVGISAAISIGLHNNISRENHSLSLVVNEMGTSPRLSAFEAKEGEGPDRILGVWFNFLPRSISTNSWWVVGLTVQKTVLVTGAVRTGD